MTGQTISHYQVLEKLGEGGMGVVYKARDTRLDRLVALKVLPPDKVADSERKRRFIQEAKAASALNHPNIITIYDIHQVDVGQASCLATPGRLQGLPHLMDFIAMEYVAGKTLDEIIPRKGLRVNEALKHAVQIADALAKAHGAGIVHRDLKPSNVMVAADGLVKVLDFGLAKLTETTALGEDGATRTLRPQSQEGAILGTVAYMSPEQAQGKPVDTRSDIFSFGSLLYEMVTGQHAFHGDSSLSTLAAILHQEPKPASQVAAGIPPELERIINRCLRKDPGRRFQTMADLKVALAELKEESDSGKLAGAAPPQADRRRPRLLRWAAALAAIVALAGSVWWRFFREASRPLPPMKTIPLTSYAGEERTPQFSPDGNLVAFAWNGLKQDNYDIYVQQIGAGAAPLRLTTHPAEDAFPAWSPDGRWIAFARGSFGKWEILMLPALGGPERTLGASAAYMAVPYWSPDGRFLTIADKSSPGVPDSIFLLSIETGEKRKLTSPPSGSWGDGTGAIAPDGQGLLLIRGSAMGIYDLYLLPLARGYVPHGEPQRLTFDNRLIWGTAWTPDGRSVVFSSNRGGSQALWRIVPGSSAPPEGLAAGGDNAYSPAVSPRGDRLAYEQSADDTNIWRLDLAGASPPIQLVASTREDYSPIFSPDGKRIVFSSTRSGHPEIWVCDRDGANPVQLTNFGGPRTGSPQWSPDGRHVAFHAMHEGQRDIYVVSAEGGSPRRLTADPSEEIAPSWSRDGRWIYFGSNRTGEYQVWKMPAGGGQAIQVTSKGGLAALESPGGKFLYYTKLPAFALWRVPVAGGEEVQVLPALPPWWVNVALTGQGIYFSPPGGAGGSSIQLLDLATGKTRPIAALQKPLGRGISISPDGRFLVYTQIDQQSSDLMLVENFR